MTKIILVKDVDNLGLAGQVTTVAPGYARNFLLPSGAALAATEGNLRRLARKRAEFETRAKAEKDQALELRGRLAEVRLVFHRKAGEKGKLYGAVTTLDISEALSAKGFEVERRRLRLGEPFKAVGDYEVPVRLHPEVTASFKISVLAENEAGQAAEPPQ
ncbi:MAG: 50S ribosomal protein L9 [Deltaproteobacteria bacterium]|nr:50S ribosomal protein L9 [Deltaproteobacteria bacterium]